MGCCATKERQVYGSSTKKLQLKYRKKANQSVCYSETGNLDLEFEQLSNISDNIRGTETSLNRK